MVQSATTARLRCVYCEREIERFVVASKKNKWYAAGPDALHRVTDHGLKEVILFADEAEARAAGFHSRRAAAEPRSARRANARSKM